MQFKYLTALCTLSLLTLAGNVQARDISMLTVEWAPHYGSELPQQGLTSAIVKAAFEAEGYRSAVDFIPWARVLKEVKADNSDVVMGACHKTSGRKRMMELVSWRKRFTVCRPVYVSILNGFMPGQNQLDYYHGLIQSRL